MQRDIPSRINGVHVACRITDSVFPSLPDMLAYKAVFREICIESTDFEFEIA